MRSYVLLALVRLAWTRPQDVCQTTTAQVIVPTATTTYITNPVVTIRPTTPRDLGTFTLVITLSSTATLETITSTVTSTATSCSWSSDHASPSKSKSVSYPSFSRPSGPPMYKRAHALSRRDCTVTVTSTTAFGQTYVFVAGSRTSSYYEYTAFTQATVTSTKTGGKAYAIATAVTTVDVCSDVTSPPAVPTATTALDERCSPSAMTSAYNDYGIDWLSNTPTGGATYVTNTTDASACCQLCAEVDSCAVSAWDIRSGKCQLEFPVNLETGHLNCGQGLLGYYDAGPISPAPPGSGWFIAELCGNAQFGQAKPDDGT